MADPFSFSPDDQAQLDAIVDTIGQQAGAAIVRELLRQEREQADWAPRALLALAHEGAMWNAARTGTPPEQIATAARVQVDALAQQLDALDERQSGQTLLALAIEGATVRMARRQLAREVPPGSGPSS